MKREMENIIISFYKGPKRLKVLSLSPSLLRIIIIINSIIIVACFIFFLAYLIQWAENWHILEQNKLLKKELIQSRR
jgi:hypothetical protein